jgi:uncharacterized membrane protein YheB (UPF0754 family)
MNKSSLTNLLALALMGISFAIDHPLASHALLYTGVFAFSGAITNTLAIHMLFEKVPLLYGSGVIEQRFEAFKGAIHTMIMEQFFTKEQIDDFFAKEEQKIDLAPLIEQTDFSPAYEALTASVMESSFGNMLGMFGGEKALESLKEPFTRKLKKAVVAITKSNTFNTQLQASLKNSTLSNDLRQRLESLIAARLEELTPQMVKALVKQLIHEHLGWLVVWGGVFGGMIGLVSALLF